LLQPEEVVLESLQARVPAVPPGSGSMREVAGEYTKMAQAEGGRDVLVETG